MSDRTLMVNQWWGVVGIPPGETHHWRIGPLDLWIKRLKGEWRVARRTGEDSVDASLESERLRDDPGLAELGDVERFAVEDEEEARSLFQATDGRI